MNDDGVRRLPIPVPPGRDEVLPGYLLRVAKVHGLTLADVTRDRTNVSNPAFGLLALRTSDACKILARQLGLSLDEFHVMEMIPPIDREMRGSAVGSLHSSEGLLNRFSRACAGCLNDHDGVWQKKWRIAGVLACVEHERLLLGRCAECGLPWFSGDRSAAGSDDASPRRGPPLQMSWVPLESYRCHAVVADGWCGADIRCQPQHEVDFELMAATKVLLTGYGENRSWWRQNWKPVWELLKPAWQSRLSEGRRHARVVDVPPDPKSDNWDIEVTAAIATGLGALWWYLEEGGAPQL